LGVIAFTAATRPALASDKRAREAPTNVRLLDHPSGRLYENTDTGARAFIDFRFGSEEAIFTNSALHNLSKQHPSVFVVNVHGGEDGHHDRVIKASMVEEMLLPGTKAVVTNMCWSGQSPRGLTADIFRETRLPSFGFVDRVDKVLEMGRDKEGYNVYFQPEGSMADMAGVKSSDVQRMMRNGELPKDVQEKLYPPAGDSCAGGACPDGIECFVKGTPVAAKGGERPIESLQVGDEVWSMDSTGRHLHRVLRTFANPPKAIRDVTIATVEGDDRRAFSSEAAFSPKVSHLETLHTTNEHPFFVVGLGWVAAKDLEPGEHVESRSGEDEIVVSSVATSDVQPVFNIEVEEAHDYFVGTGEVLVHNRCGRMGSRFTSTWGDKKAALGGMAAGMALGYVGESIGGYFGGEWGAKGGGYAAGAAFSTLMAAGTWRGTAIAGGTAVANIGVGILTDWALRKAGVQNEGARLAGGIGAGAVVDGLGAWAAGGSLSGGLMAAAQSGLYGIVLAEVSYVGYQIQEINYWNAMTVQLQAKWSKKEKAAFNKNLPGYWDFFWQDLGY
jgi:hypothetical protein